MNQPVTGVPQMLPTQVIDTSTDSREIQIGRAHV